MLNDANFMLEMAQVKFPATLPSQKYVLPPWATQPLTAIAWLLCFAFVIAALFPGVLYIVCAVFVTVYLQEMKVRISMDLC